MLCWLGPASKTGPCGVPSFPWKYSMISDCQRSNVAFWSQLLSHPDVMKPTGPKWLLIMSHKPAQLIKIYRESLCENLYFSVFFVKCAEI